MHPKFRVLCTLFFVTSVLAVSASNRQWPEDSLTLAEVETHLRFLASDELAGRRTGTAGNDVAARYLAEQFRAAGVQPPPGLEDYFQPLPLFERIAPEVVELQLADRRWTLDEDLFILSGGGVELRAPAVFLESIGPESGLGLDLQAKILFTAFSRRSRDRSEAASKLSAAALVELLDDRRWDAFARFRRSSWRLSLSGGSEERSPSIPHLLVRDPSGQVRRKLQELGAVEAFLRATAPRDRPVRSRNVVGIIPGADPQLRQQYVAIVAHYDHLGSDPDHPWATPADSVFNGAIDNGMGTVALISAAKSLAARPPRRSILLAAVTAEEQGLLGSRYLAQNPPVPLEKILFLLNSDGGGLSDPKVVTVLGLDRTSAKPLIQSACRDFGLEAISGPPEVQYLFNQSDNLSFARLGIPSPTFSPGFRTFSRESTPHYHRPSDQAGDDFNFLYLLRFAQAFARAARSVADHPERPRWVSGDRYEAAAQTLYGADYRE